MKAAIVTMLALTIVPAGFAAGEDRPLTTIQTIAAARGGEALDQVERIALQFWPTMKPESLPLIIVDPGEWALLMNHPAPPPGFEAAAPVPRYYLGGEHGVDEGVPETPGSWSVAIAAAADATAGLDPAPRDSAVIGGLRTAVVRLNEVTVPSASFSGWPPAEATIGRMVRQIWLAHLDALEGEPEVAPMVWDYEASAEDLALIAVEQRLLARIMRVSYTEKTMEGYRKMFTMWLAVRKARMESNPRAVALEEAVERRAGLADFTETVPFRVLNALGNEVRPRLEEVDPFYDRYRNNFILRINVLNYPLTWYPAGPAEALQRARATGAALAFAAWPISVKWNLNFLSPDGSVRRSLREVIEAALAAEWPADAGARKEIHDEALDREGYRTVLPVMRALLSETGAAGGRRSQKGPGGAGTPLTLELGPRRVTGYHAALEGQRWLGGRGFAVDGPADLAFEGGRLSWVSGTAQLASAPDRAAGQAPGTVRITLPPDAVLAVDGKEIDLPRFLRSGKAMEGAIKAAGPGLTLRIDRGRVVGAPGGITVADLPSGQ